MSSINYYLNPPSKQNLCAIMLTYQSRGKKFRYSTRIQIHKSQWNGKEIIGKSLEIFDLNQKLKNYIQVIENIEREALVNRTEYPVSVVEQKFREIAEAPPPVKTSEFFTYYDQFREISRTTKTKGTVFGYGCTIKRLKEYEAKTGKEITFHSMNKAFYDGFVNYLITDLGQLNNSVGKHIKTLKAFLNWVKQNDFVPYHINTSGFKTIREDVDIIALTQQELAKIYQVKDLPPHLDFVRDYFCFECFTGMRFSDISRLRNENVKDDFLVFRTQKTRDNLMIPLNVFTREIIEKYKGKFADRPIPPTFTNQKTNEYIKAVAKRAGITDQIIVEKFSGANRIELCKPKWAFICTHTGRRTFITLSYENGMQPEMIMKITGIKSWNTLKKYLKVSEKAKLIKMQEFWNLESMKAFSL